MTTLQMPDISGSLRRLGVVGVLFFTAKGLLWLTVPALIAYFT